MKLAGYSELGLDVPDVGTPVSGMEKGPFPVEGEQKSGKSRYKPPPSSVRRQRRVPASGGGPQ
jgi:hypothetical protein